MINHKPGFGVFARNEPELGIAFAGRVQAPIAGHAGKSSTPELQISLVQSENGYSSKTVLGDDGAIEISVPRDRNGTFEPQTLFAAVVEPCFSLRERRPVMSNGPSMVRGVPPAMPALRFRLVHARSRNLSSAHCSPEFVRLDVELLERLELVR